MEPSRKLSANSSRETVINGIPVPQTATAEEFPVPQTATAEEFPVPQTATAEEFLVPQTATAEEFSVPQTATAEEFSVPQTATAEEFPVGGHDERWENFDNAVKMPIGGLNGLEILADIDPLGLHKPLVRQYLEPPAPVVTPQPAVIPVRSTIALRYAAEFRRLELDLAEYRRAQAIEEGPDRVLQQDISAPGIQMNTAAPAPFIVPLSGNVTEVAATAPIEIPIPNLVVSALEPTHRRQEPAAVKKAVENIEVIAVHSEHNSSESFIEGSFSSSNSQQ